MSLRDSLLRSFDEKSGQTLSGTLLSRRLGVSRTAIWKQIQAFKAMGFPIESAGRTGYRLAAPFDYTLADLKGPVGMTPHYSLTSVSTQVSAKAGAAAGLPEGHIWLSELQTKGRGRLQRAWESAYGGLWMSLLLRPKLSPARMAPLTLVAGLSLRDTVEEVAGVNAFLKWPNDLVIRAGHSWKKCAGILTEMAGQMELTEWLVIGVGLNVQNAISDELTSRAVSLHTITGKVWPRAVLVETFLTKFRTAYQRFCNSGFGPFQKSYWQHYYAADKPVHLNTADGPVTGMARGVDALGAIMIESRRKMRSFTEGEIAL